jgi:SAM-dependent methyltransferase
MGTSDYQLDPELLTMLCCPRCRGDLAYEALAELSCAACEFVFPIIDGIPVLFPVNVKARFEELFDRYWDSAERAEKYDRFVEGQESLIAEHSHLGEIRATLRVLGPLGKERLLDAGCGNGRFFVHLPIGLFAVGIDASLNLLRICKAKGRCSRLVCCELEHLPFKDSVFDRVLSVRVLQHLHNQREAVCEMSRVCKVGGQAILHCYNELSSKAVVKRIRESRLSPMLNFPFRALFRSLSPFAPWEIPYDKYSTVPQIRRWLRECGVRTLEIRGAGFGFHKWFFEDFFIAPVLEARARRVWNGYLAKSLWMQNAVGGVWPFNYLMEKFVIKGVKTGLASTSSYSPRSPPGAGS